MASPASGAAQSQPRPSMPTNALAHNDSRSPAPSSITLPGRSKSVDNDKKSPPFREGFLQRLRCSMEFENDFRDRLPPNVSRFLGYRPPSHSHPYDALPIFPFTLLNRISLKHEAWLFAFIGSLGSIFLIEAIMSAHTTFQIAYHSPIIISSFGASAVLVFGAIESPLAQPRNLVFGHFVSGVVSVGMTRLWALNGSYTAGVENVEFYAPVLVNGGLCMSVSLLVQLLLGVVHPPGGATGLAAATEKGVVLLSWKYLPVLLASATIMLGWAMIVNNLGRRRYPVHWFSPDKSFVKKSSTSLTQPNLKRLEEGIFGETSDGDQEAEAFHVEEISARGAPV